MPNVLISCTRVLLAACLLVIPLAGVQAASPPINDWGKGGGFFSDPPRTGVAIRGYDTVAYFTQQAPVEGKPELVHEWMGAKWQFSSQENLELFMADPEKYAPQYGGYCAYGLTRGNLVKIDPEAWAVVDDKLYLNYSNGVQKTWRKDTQKYIRIADEAFPKLLEEKSDR